MMNLSELSQKIRQVFPSEQAEVFEEYANAVSEFAKANDLTEIKSIVRELVESQKRTEQKFEELAKSHYELTETVEKLSKSHYELAQSHSRLTETVEKLSKSHYELAKSHSELTETVEKLSKSHSELTETVEKLSKSHSELAESHRELTKIVAELTQSVKELTESQKKLEHRVDRLEQAVEALIKAQQKTEEELKSLILEHKITRQELGGLSHTVGYILEDRAYKSLPSLLKEQHNIQITEPLKRKTFPYKGDRKIEVNVIGKGSMNNKEIWIIGEAKSQLKKRHVEQFFQRRYLFNEIFPGEKFYLMITYMTEESIEKYAESLGIKVYYSYEL